MSTTIEFLEWLHLWKDELKKKVGEVGDNVTQIEVLSIDASIDRECVNSIEALGDIDDLIVALDEALQDISR